MPAKVGSSIVVHKHWSRSQSMVVKVKDDNGFQDVPLIPWPIKIALNSVQIQLAIKRNASPFPDRTSPKWYCFLGVAGGIDGIRLLPHMGSFINHVQKKVAFIAPMNLFSRCKIPSVAYLTPCKMCCFVCWCQKGTIDRPGSVPSCLQPIEMGLR